MATEATMVYNTAFSDSAATGGPRVNIDYRMKLVARRESSAPFLSFMLNLNSEATKTHEFRTFETRPNPKKGTITTGSAVGASANSTRDVIMTAAHSKRFNVGDIVIADTSVAADATQSVVGIVTVVTTGTGTITIRPNDPTMKLAAIVVGGILQIWGNSMAQGTLSRNPSSTKPDLKTFYTQIFKDGYRVTKTHANNRLYGAPERDRLRGEKEIEHMIEINKSLYRGDGILDTTNDSDPRTTLTGLLTGLTSNVLEYGASLDKFELFDFMTDLHAPRYAADGNMMRRLVLASASVMNDVQRIVEDKNQVMPVAKVYGVNVSQLIWAGRTWDFVEDPILSDFLPGYFFVIQPRYIKLREFRPTRIEANIQANNADYFEDQFLTEVGLEVQLEELHGYGKH